MDPVGRVTIHHEGAGAPSDNVQRFSEGGYSYAIGLTRWVRFRSPRENWATLGWNHRDLTICLSGNRMDHDVTDSDIALIHGAFMDCLERREVDPRPDVVAHRNSPGSSTVCPGDQTMVRWNDVVNACRASAPAPAPPPKEDIEMQVIAVANPKAGSNQQPFGYLDTVARRVWSCWGFKISWDGGSGDSPLQGDKDPKSFGVPGTAPLVGWEVVSTGNEGQTKRICAYGVQGAEYVGTAHG
jgi:hypothetical protein